MKKKIASAVMAALIAGVSAAAPFTSVLSASIIASAASAPVLSGGSGNISGGTLTFRFTADSQPWGFNIYYLVTEAKSYKGIPEVSQINTKYGVPNNGVPTEIKVPGVQNTAKDVYVVAKDSNGGVSAVLPIYNITDNNQEITGPSTPHAPPVDTTAPVLSGYTGYRVSYNSASFYFTANETGTAYYAVTTGGAMSADSVMKSGYRIDNFHGSSNNITVPVSTAVNYIYIVVKDAASNVSKPVSIKIDEYYVHHYDTTPPSLYNGHYSRVSDTKGTFHFTTNESGNAYYYVTGSGTSVTSSTVVSKGDYIGYVYGTSDEISLKLSSGEKKVNIVVVDNAGNHSDVLAIKIPEYSEDAPAPTNGSAVRVSATGAQINFYSGSAGTAYYLVTDPNTGTPAPHTVKLTGTRLGSVNGWVLNSDIYINGTGAKTVYVAVEDRYGVLSGWALKINVPAYKSPSAPLTPAVPEVTLPSVTAPAPKAGSVNPASLKADYTGTATVYNPSSLTLANAKALTKKGIKTLKVVETNYAGRIIFVSFVKTAAVKKNIMFNVNIDSKNLTTIKSNVLRWYGKNVDAVEISGDLGAPTSVAFRGAQKGTYVYKYEVVNGKTKITRVNTKVVNDTAGYTHFTAQQGWYVIVRGSLV